MKFKGKWMKGVEKEIEIMHRMRSTPFSYHRVGNIVEPTPDLTPKEIKEARTKWKKIEKIRKERNKARNP